MKTIKLGELKNQRENAGWSQEMLAEMADVSLRTIQRVEAGNQTSIETAKALASALSLPSHDSLSAAPRQVTHSDTGYKTCATLGVLSLGIILCGFIMGLADGVWRLFDPAPVTGVESYMLGISFEPAVYAISLGLVGLTLVVVLGLSIKAWQNKQLLFCGQNGTFRAR
jgi:DNA-binding XRE family transcriptional regulator